MLGGGLTDWEVRASVGGGSLVGRYGLVLGGGSLVWGCGLVSGGLAGLGVRASVSGTHWFGGEVKV